MRHARVPRARDPRRPRPRSRAGTPARRRDRMARARGLPMPAGRAPARNRPYPVARPARRNVSRWAGIARRRGAGVAGRATRRRRGAGGRARGAVRARAHGEQGVGVAAGARGAWRADRGATCQRGLGGQPGPAADEARRVPEHDLPAGDRGGRARRCSSRREGCRRVLVGAGLPGGAAGRRARRHPRRRRGASPHAVKPTEREPAAMSIANLSTSTSTLSSSASAAGKSYRLGRIFAGDGRTVILPVDHGTMLGRVARLEDPAALIRAFLPLPCDGFLLGPGVAARTAPLFADRSAPARLVTIDTYWRGDSGPHVPTTSRERAAALGVDAVKVLMPWDVPPEERAARAELIGGVISAAEP